MYFRNLKGMRKITGYTATLFQIFGQEVKPSLIRLTEYSWQIANHPFEDVFYDSENWYQVFRISTRKATPIRDIYPRTTNEGIFRHGG